MRAVRMRGGRGRRAGPTCLRGARWRGHPGPRRDRSPRGPATRGPGAPFPPCGAQPRTAESPAPRGPARAIPGPAPRESGPRTGEVLKVFPGPPPLPGRRIFPQGSRNLQGGFAVTRDSVLGVAPKRLLGFWVDLREAKSWHE